MAAKGWRYRCLVVEKTMRQRWVTVTACGFSEASKLAREAAKKPEDDGSRWEPSFYEHEGVLRAERLCEAEP